MTVTRSTCPPHSSPSTFLPNRWTRPAGLDQPGPINLEKACAPTTAWAGTWCRAMWTVSAPVTHFAQVGESWELRVWRPAALA
jgi:riboflavin synthase